MAVVDASELLDDGVIDSVMVGEIVDQKDLGELLLA